MDRGACDAPGPPAGRLSRPFSLCRRPVARPRRRRVPPVRRLRRFRCRTASLPLRPLRRLPSPVRRRALPLRLRGRRSRRDRRGEIRGPHLPGRRRRPPPPRDLRGAMERPDPGRGSPDRGPGAGPSLEIFAPRVQPPRAHRVPPFAAPRSPVRSAGAVESPESGFPRRDFPGSFGAKTSRGRSGYPGAARFRGRSFCSTTCSPPAPRPKRAPAP